MAVAMVGRTETVPSDATWKQEMERKIDALTREIEKSKLGQTAEEKESAFTPSNGLAPAASKIYRTHRGVSFGGYGEMLLAAPDHERDDGTASGRKRSLDFLRAILYAGYKFNDRILFNSEIEFEHATTGEGAEEKGEVSLEFAYLDFLYKPWMNARAGLLLAPIGLTNEMHEPTTFHGSMRPAVERNIIPSTWRENGAGIYGDAGPLTYRTYLMAGLQGTESGSVEGFRASNAIRNGRSSGSNSTLEDIAWVGRVDYIGLPGTKVGGSLYTGQSGQNSTTAAGEEIDGRVTLWEIHGTSEFRGVELKTLYTQGTIGDVTAINNANSLTGSNSVGERFFGGYAEVAWNVLSLGNSPQYLAPFFRYERYDSQQRVPAGFSKNPANSRTEYVIGVSYKPITQVVIKGDWQNVENQAGTGVNQVNFALGYIF